MTFQVDKNDSLVFLTAPCQVMPPLIKYSVRYQLDPGLWYFHRIFYC